MTSKEIKVQGLTLYITNEHVHHGGAFIFHCKELGLREQPLKAKELVVALSEATVKISQKLKAWEKAYELLRLEVTAYIVSLEQEDDKA